MAQHEFNPEAHEEFVSARLAKLRIQAARVALFDEMIDYHLNGDCTLEQALTQFMHDADVAGIGYDTPTDSHPLAS